MKQWICEDTKRARELGVLTTSAVGVQTLYAFGSESVARQFAEEMEQAQCREIRVTQDGTIWRVSLMRPRRKDRPDYWPPHHGTMDCEYDVI